MPNLESWIAFVITSLAIILVPGPSVLFTVGRTLALGRQQGLVTVVANALGTTTWLVAVSLGLGTILGYWPWALFAIKIAGAIYLGYLGIGSIRHRHASTTEITSAQEAPQKLSKTWKQGYLVGVSNPKTAVFFTAVLPQFVNPSGNLTLQLLVLGIVFEVLGILGDSSWVLAAAAARNWIFGKTNRLSGIVGTGGVLIVVLAATLLVLALTGRG
jgi:threonine/homoserine/homoserine lactone efflux protein